MGSVHNLKRSLAGAAALSLILNSAVLQAAAQSPEGGGTAVLAVPAGTLGDVLSEISLRTGVPVIFAEELVAGRLAPSVTGTYSAEEAVRQVLAGTGLEVRAGRSGALRIVRAAAHAEPAVTTTARRQSQPVRTEPQGEEADLRIDQVVVTGTSLRGIAPESSPLQIYSRADILGSGVTTTEQFIRTLPQNFGGGSSEFITLGLPNDGEAAATGAGVNLRGLGNGGTLVLLNGNRLAPTSALGNFVDLSIIPVTALDRVDVLTDGASAVYGGDAVAGVVNFILRDDFEGAETSFRYGTDDGGDLEETRIGQTLGHAWGSGNVLATYEYFNRSNLTLADRPGIEAPRVVSGDDPAGPDKFDLLPSERRNSGVLSVRQDLTPGIRLSATGLFSRRDSRHSVIGYVAAGDAVVSDRKSTSYALSLGADADLSDVWSLSLRAGLSNQNNEIVSRSQARQSRVVSENDSDSRSLDLILNGALFELPAGPVRVAAGGHLRREDFILESSRNGVLRKARRDVTALFGEVLIPVIGPEAEVPGVRRLEISLSGRVDDYSDFGTASNPRIGLLWSPSENLKLRSSYSESFAPPAIGQAGDRTGSANVLPTTLVMQVLGYAGQYPELDGTGYILVTGVASDLDPQTSRTFTAGADWEHSGRTGAWSASINYYDLEFEGRLGTVPIPDNLDPAFAPFLQLEDPSVFPPGTILFNPAAGQVAELIAGLDFPPELQFGATLENVGVINNVGVTRNLASTRTSGMDAMLNYERTTPLGDLSLGVNASYILKFESQAASSTPGVDVLNTLYNPVDLNIRIQGGLKRGGLAGTLFVNHVAGYKSDQSADAVAIDPWTTVDVSLSYGFADRAGWLKDLRLGLTVQNLLDTDPPEAPVLRSFSIAGYDPTNASPVGRFIALELSKSF